MSPKLHAAAGGIAFLCVLTFWTSTAYSEVFGTYETIAAVKAAILKGMVLLIPAMAFVGASGMVLGKKRKDKRALAKKKRMPMIAVNGLLILLPSAVFLHFKASNAEFDNVFFAVQALELVAGAVNLTFMGLNIRDGRAMARRRKT